MKDRPGLRIAQRYLVERELDHGAGGEAYVVFDERKQQRLVLKLGARARDPGDSPLPATFRREYALLVQLAHPNVVRVFDFGDHEGVPYYTMEWLDGVHPGATGPMSVAEVCRMLVALCGPLALLHSRGWVHRDLSPRNVRLVSNGAIKLLDFGAIATMDAEQRPLGTPPCVAPETLHRQRLDARTDLYGLGALGYFALTGQHAYPAHVLTQLPLLWQTAPSRPSESNPEIPAALDDLILSLLNLDMQARPRQLSEVLQRLSAFTELRAGDVPAEVAAAYLPTPDLVGRERELGLLRDLLDQGGPSRGATCIVRGARGSGCTRLLDEMALEAQLRGRLIARAHAGLCGASAFALARELARQLQSAAPVEAVADELALLERELLSDAQVVAAQRAFLELCERLCQAHALLIIVDECEAADAESAKLLAQLAQRSAELPLTLALSARTERAKLVGPLHALGREAWWIALDPLTFAGTERLLSTMFGDVPSLTRAAHWAQRVGGGQPSATVAAARMLVTAGVAKFRDGSWQLPERFDLEQLSLDEPSVMARTWASLSDTAREFMSLLSLVTQPAPLALALYVRALSLTETQRALVEGELFAAHVLVWTGKGYTLRDASVLARIREQMSATEIVHGHARLAEFYAGEAALFCSAYHLWRAGALDAADATLDRAFCERVSWDGQTVFRFELTNEAADLYEATLLRRSARGAPPSELHALRSMLMVVAGTARVDLVKYVPEAMARWRFDAGLDLWSQADAALDPPARIRACLAQAQQRYHETPEAERGVPPEVALEALASSAVMLCVVYAMHCDVAGALELLAQIEPLRWLTPALELIVRLTEVNARSVAYGADVRELRRAVVHDTRQDLPGLPPSLRHVMHHFSAFHLGLELAVDGDDEALALAAELQRVAGFEGLALQLRRLHALAYGRFEEAQSLRRQRELLTFQSTTIDNHLQLSTLHEMRSLRDCRDPLELSRLAAFARERANEHPGWLPHAALAQACVHLVSDEPASAVAVTEAACAQLQPFAHAAYCHLVGTGAEAQNELRQHAQAERAIERVLSDAAARGLELAQPLLLQATLAVARAGLGKRELALTQLDDLLARCDERHGASTLVYGRLCEARCQAACIVKDYSGFVKHLDRMGAIYANHPNLRGRHARWVRAGRERFSKLIELLAKTTAAADWATRSEGELRVGSRAHQAQHLLAMLLDELPAELGQLYRVEGTGSLQLLAARPVPADPLLLTAAERFLAQWSETDEVQTADEDQAQAAVDTHERSFIPLWLTHPERPDELVGLALVACTSDALSRLSPVLVRALAQQLETLAGTAG